MCKNGFIGETPEKRKNRKSDYMTNIVYTSQQENASVIAEAFRAEDRSDLVFGTDICYHYL